MMATFIVLSSQVVFGQTIILDEPTVWANSNEVDNEANWIQSSTVQYRIDVMNNGGYIIGEYTAHFDAFGRLISAGARSLRSGVNLLRYRSMTNVWVSNIWISGSTLTIEHHLQFINLNGELERPIWVTHHTIPTPSQPFVAEM